MNAYESLLRRLTPPKETESVEITSLTIEEISGVDDPASGLPFLIMKSKELGMSPAAYEAASARLDMIEKALKPKAGPNSPYFGELDPNNPYPLGPQGLPVAGGTVPPPDEAIDVKPLLPQPTQEAVNVSGEDAAPNTALNVHPQVVALRQLHGENLERLRPSDAQNLSMRPTTAPEARQVLRRRANRR